MFVVFNLLAYTTGPLRFVINREIVTEQVDESQTTLSGLPAHKIITESTLSKTEIHTNIVEIFTLKNAKLYQVTYTVGEEEDLPIIQQMIDSFQITK